jgi:hypothetical protein
MRHSHLRGLLTAATGAALVLAVSAGTSAQDGQPPHPAHIHDGTCASIGDIVHPLSDVSIESLVDGAPSAGDVVGEPNDDPSDQVLVSITTVDATIEDLTSAQFAINVHLSAEEMGVFIACGDVAGTLVLEPDDSADDVDETDDAEETDDPDDANDADDMDEGLAIRLREQSDSGVGGIAWLSEADDEDQTVVHLFVFQDPVAEAAPAESPVAESPAATAAPADTETPTGSPGTESPAPTDGSPAPTAGATETPESPAPTAAATPPAAETEPPAESPAPASPSE